MVTITPAQLGYLLEGIDWHLPQHTWRPLEALCDSVAAWCLAAGHAMIIAQRDALMAAQARASAAESEAKFRALLIEKLKYTIAKLRHEKFGQSSERAAILEQLEHN